jgi:hypothetical protein
MDGAVTMKGTAEPTLSASYNVLVFYIIRYDSFYEISTQKLIGVDNQKPLPVTSTIDSSDFRETISRRAFWSALVYRCRRVASSVRSRVSGKNSSDCHVVTCMNGSHRVMLLNSTMLSNMSFAFRQQHGMAGLQRQLNALSSPKFSPCASSRRKQRFQFP